MGYEPPAYGCCQRISSKRAAGRGFPPPCSGALCLSGTAAWGISGSAVRKLRKWGRKVWPGYALLQPADLVLRWHRCNRTSENTGGDGIDLSIVSDWRTCLWLPEPYCGKKYAFCHAFGGCDGWDVWVWAGYNKNIWEGEGTDCFAGKNLSRKHWLNTAGGLL